MTWKTYTNFIFWSETRTNIVYTKCKWVFQVVEVGQQEPQASLLTFLPTFPLIRESEEF